MRLRDHEPVPEIGPAEAHYHGFWVGVLWGLVPGIALGVVAGVFLFCRVAEQVTP